jgi:HEAT repeat protein
MAAMDFVTILRALQSNDNVVRSQAEKSFEDAKKQSAAPTVAGLFQVISQQQVEEHVREQAGVLLRQCLNLAEEQGSAWQQLGGAGQAECKGQLLKLLECEPSPKVRRKVADALQHIGNQLITIPDGQRPVTVEAWPELLPTLMRMLMDNSKDAGVRADALWAMKELQPCLWPVMVGNVQQSAQVLQAALADAGSEAVRAGAAALLCELVDNLEHKAEQQALVPLIDPLCAVLRQLAEGADNKHMNELLQSMQASENSTDFFKDSMGTQLLPLLTAIAKGHKAEDTRRLALEVVISFPENKPKAMSTVPGFIQQALDLCVHFLMQANDDVEAWAAEEDDDEAEDEEENLGAGKESLDRLCSCMQKAELFPQVLEALKPAIAQLLQQANDWKRVVAGLYILAQIAEYIDEEEAVNQMVGAVKSQLRNSHMRVRHAAWGALAQFSQDHSDVLSGDAMAAQLLQDFVVGLDDPSSRVLQQCMEAFHYLGASMDREILEPLLQVMMEKLGSKLQSPSVPVQKKSITFIAVVAGQVEDSFAPYYGPLMPLLKQLVMRVLHKAEERSLLGKLFECISLVAKSAGPGGFRADAEDIMQAMIQATQIPNLPASDPVLEYMMSASERICATMQADFLPFVPHLLPFILAKVKFTPTKYDQSQVESYEENEGEQVAVVQDGESVKMLVMSTSVMEELKNALDCVHTFVDQLGKLYAPFVMQTAQALQPVFDFSMREDIRAKAFDTWCLLCEVMCQNGEVQVLGQLVQEFLTRVLPKLAAGSEVLDVAAQKTCAQGVKNCLSKAGPGILNAEQVKQICGMALKALEESVQRREAEKINKHANKDNEPEDDEDEDEEMDLRVACIWLVGALMQHHPDIFAQEALQPCLALVQTFLPPSVDEMDRLLALLLVGNMLNRLGPRVTSQWPQFLPQILKDITNHSDDMRQPACWCISCAAKDPAFAEFALETSLRLAELVSQTRKLAKKKSFKPAQACADNALSALIEILLNHPGVAGSQEARVWSVWVTSMPCQVDEAEGVKNHKKLLELVCAERPEVLGEGGANFPQIVATFVEVYNSEMADEDTSKGIGQLFLKLGQPRLEQLSAQLKDKQQKKVLRIHREAQKVSA